MKNRKYILKGAGVLLMAAIVIINSVGVIADTNTLQILSSDTIFTTNYNDKNSQIIVWDNNMSYRGLIRAQYDSSIPLDCYPADDFQFTEDTLVCDVHWIGGYWFGDYQHGDFDWVIKFYEDRGDGRAPGAVYAGPFNFTWNEINITFLQDTGIMIFYELAVFLPQNVIFQGGDKYWISIWGIGYEPPNSGLGFHYDPILQHKAMVQSFYFFGDNEWHGAEELAYEPSDLCFQLTTKQNEPPGRPIIDGPSTGKPVTEVCWTFHSDDPNGDMVRYVIDWGDGTSTTTGWYPACEPVEVCHTYDEEGDYIITVYAEDEEGLRSEESSYTVTIPRAINGYHPLILRMFERFPSVFPLLRCLLNLQ